MKQKKRLWLYVIIFTLLCVACEEYNSTTDTSDQTVQCSGITQAGARCKRKTTNTSGLCWQHE